MAHPHNEHRAHKVEKERVKHLCGGGYASGGAVKEKVATKALASHKAEHEALKSDGKKTKHRGDRVKRAKGGRVKHKGGHGKTNVNVIVAPKGDGAGAPPMAGLGPKPPMPAIAPPPGALPGAPPPMAAKPPMPPMGGPGMGAPPPGMPMRKKGGRVAHDTSAVVTHAKGAKGASEADYKPMAIKGATTDSIPASSTAKRYTEKVAAQNAKKELSHFGGSQVGRKRGGKVNGGVNGADGQGRTGIGFRLPVQHSGNKDDTQNIGRGKPVTYAKGGKVDAIKRGGEQQYARAEAFDKHEDGDGNKPAGGRKQYSDGWNVHTKPTNRATGGPIYADGMEGKGMGPDMKEGSRSGLGRLEKARRSNKSHAL